jgi:hypothetical protein
MTGSVKNCCTQKTAIQSAHDLVHVSKRMVEGTKILKDHTSLDVWSILISKLEGEWMPPAEMIKATGVVVLRDDHWLCAANFMQVEWPRMEWNNLSGAW